MRLASCVLLVVLCLSCLSCRAQTKQAAPAPDTAASAKAFVDLLAKGDYATAVAGFDETMARVMSADKTRETWEALVAQTGPLKQQVEVQQTQQGGYDIVFVTCQFEKASLDVKVVYDHQGRIAGLWFVPAGSGKPYQAPTYVKPDSFTESEVVVGKGQWALPGTLALPKGSGPVPALVLVHGSGPQDRDETIGPNRPFRDLAWGLASRGIAVLRYEKRTKAHQAEMAAVQAKLTVAEETVDDALSAAALLRKTKGIDPNRVFILGHSLGGMLIPRIAVNAPRVAGYIIMAGSNRPLEDAIVEQMEYIASLGGPQGEEVAKQLDQVKAQVARVKDPNLSPRTPAAQLPLGVPAKYWLDLRAYHPLEVVKRVKQPILVLQGGRDYQVTTDEFNAWRKALAGRTNVTFKLYPDLNHLFAEGKGKATPAEYEQPQHVAPPVIDDTAQWINGQPE
jgi:dienelactone hydrolase